MYKPIMNMYMPTNFNECVIIAKMYSTYSLLLIVYFISPLFSMNVWSLAKILLYSLSPLDAYCDSKVKFRKMMIDQSNETCIHTVFALQNIIEPTLFISASNR